MHPGDQLRDIRHRLDITTREVEEHSRAIAEAEGNEEFYISNAWLTQIENKHSTPSIYKLFSLSAIYRTKFTDLLRLFGVDLEKISRYELATPLAKTHVATLEVYDRDRAVTFPVRFDPGFRPDRTNLLSRIVEIWGEIPIAIIQHLNFREARYGYIGLQDYTLHPLLRPGSFVQIDDRENKVRRLKLAYSEFPTNPNFACLSFRGPMEDFLAVQMGGPAGCSHSPHASVWLQLNSGSRFAQLSLSSA